MKVLIIGSGGREHAIAYKLNLSDKVSQIYAIPGNPGIASFGINVSGSVEDIPFILNFAKENKIDLVVIGPEVPLCMGLADTLEENGFKVFGPRQKAAMLEGSKAFSKEFMIKHNIPTAKYVEVNNYDQSIKALDNFSYPLVIKADGLAAGKGVVIVNDEKEAKETLKAMLVDNYLSGAGKKVVIE